MKSLVSFLVVALVFGVPAVSVGARPPGQIVTATRVGEFSSFIAPNHAIVGAHIAVRRSRPAQADTSAPAVDGSAPREPSVPNLASGSPLLQSPHPMGPGTVWYAGSPGQQCIYVPSTSPLCFVVVQRNANRIDPVQFAAEVARTMDLSLSPIEASPSASRNGLTGDRTWFWLGAAPARTQASVRLGGERVTVMAEPSAIEWGFGDARVRTAGAGVAYRPGPPPSEAITHVYETRCLPGDQGRNPNVLRSCEGDGYHVLARVQWTISFTATGPAVDSGGLPARTTESELVYPVSEARGFLVGGSP
jgi:hypothetical protein